MIKKYKVDFCGGIGWVGKFSDYKEEQEKSGVQLTCSQMMPRTSNRVDCLAFSP